MRIIRTRRKLREYLARMRLNRFAIGFVPTLGYLHEGHFALIEAAVLENDKAVVSVFVNPTQFGPREDYESYPRDLDADAAAAERLGAAVVFAPDVEEMYPDGDRVRVSVAELGTKLCGRSRAGHFDGVTTVVAKLFHLVSPDRAYFGAKDAQQVAVVKRMVSDLDFATEIRVVPTVREPDGLALSSRNVGLTPGGRAAAAALSRGLRRIEELFEGGEQVADALKAAALTEFESERVIELEYLEIVDAETLDPTPIVEGPTLVALAAHVDGVRLIDNVMLADPSAASSQD